MYHVSILFEIRTINCLASFKGALVFIITTFNIKNSVPLKTVYSNITIDGLFSFKL